MREGKKTAAACGPFLPLAFLIAAQPLHGLDPGGACQVRRRLPDQHVMQMPRTPLRDEGLVAREIIAADKPWPLGGLRTPTGEQALGRMEFPVLFGWAIAVAPGCHIPGHDSV